MKDTDYTFPFFSKITSIIPHHPVSYIQLIHPYDGYYRKRENARELWFSQIFVFSCMKSYFSVTFFGNSEVFAPRARVTIDK